jgi:hypothetical protein
VICRNNSKSLQLSGEDNPAAVFSLHSERHGSSFGIEDAAFLIVCNASEAGRGWEGWIFPSGTGPPMDEGWRSGTRPDEDHCVESCLEEFRHTLLDNGG